MEGGPVRTELPPFLYVNKGCYLPNVVYILRSVGNVI